MVYHNTTGGKLYLIGQELLSFLLMCYYHVDSEEHLHTPVATVHDWHNSNENYKEIIHCEVGNKQTQGNSWKDSGELQFICIILPIILVVS